MTEKIEMKPEEKELSAKDHKALIAGFPLFSLLGAKDIKALADIAKEVYVETGAVITREGEIVDSVYLIVSGTADVSRTITNVEKSMVMSIATLVRGDSIGLGKTGFFSHRGIRTATVTATSPMVLLSIDIRNFQRFLQRPEITYPALKNAGEMILLMNFLRESHLFKHLTPIKIHRLAKIVNKTTVKSGAILFKDGDKADECYYILSGKVCLTRANGDEKIAKIIEPGRILGEEEFVEGSVRKSAARAETDCELIILNRQQINEIEAEHSSSAGEVISGMIDKMMQLWKK